MFVEKIGKRWVKRGATKHTANGGIKRQPNGCARVFRCAVCQRRKICTKTGVQYLCVECRGGQGL